jgi:hypothetical protein
VKQWSQVVKYSFEGSYLAIGSHDRKIYVYKRSIDGHYTFKCTIPSEPTASVDDDDSSVDGASNSEGHASYITHIDFGVISIVGSKVYDETTGKITEYEKGVPRQPPRGLDTEHDICIQSTSAAYELLYWHVDGTRIDSPSLMKDAFWATWTSPFGKEDIYFIGVAAYITLLVLGGFILCFDFNVLSVSLSCRY